MKVPYDSSVLQHFMTVYNSGRINILRHYNIESCKKTVVECVYFCMSDLGYWDGECGFKIKFQRDKSMTDFELVFSDKVRSGSSYRARKYDLRGHLDMVTYDTLCQILTPYGVNKS